MDDTNGNANERTIEANAVITIQRPVWLANDELHWQAIAINAKAMFVGEPEGQPGKIGFWVSANDGIRPGCRAVNRHGFKSTIVIEEVKEEDGYMRLIGTRS